MIIGIDEIHKRVKEEQLIESLSQRELHTPEGAGIDIRIGKAFRLDGNAFLGIEERSTPQPVLVSEFEEGKNAKLVLKPGEYVLTETIEKFNMPADLVGIAKPRTTLHRSGVIARMGTIDPGYKGTLHPGLYNAGQSTITIEMGARYINILFLLVRGETKSYRGQWQGGRVGTEGREKQI